MIKQLTLPKGVKEELNIQDDNIGDSFILSNKSVVETKTEDGEDIA
jgi:hypothetical protein